MINGSKIVSILILERIPDDFLLSSFPAFHHMYR